VLDPAGTARTLTWAQIEQRAWAAREAFRARELPPGGRVLLMLPTGEEHAASLLGALWAGLVPTTLFPYVPSASGAEQEISELVRAFGPQATVGAGAFREASGLDIPLEEFVPREVPAEPDFSLLQPLAYVQFTSGSTGRPRGLALDWAAIEANLDVIVETLGADRPGERAVSWLPMYHDMGLFGSLLALLHAGCEHTLMDPKLFAANPLLWLRVLHEQRATMTVAPPSALKACLDLVRRRPPAGLDLSALRQVVCGAEPIPPSLPQIFAEVMQPYGVGADVLRPCYGLAEATVAVSFTPRGRAAVIDRVERHRFETDGVGVPVEAQQSAAVEWVSAGQALPGIHVKVLDDEGHPLPDRHVGRIWLSSPSLFSGVLDEGSVAPREGGWLDTGDLGYMVGAEIYVTGRRKDIIIKNGRNYAPERLEHVASLAERVRRCAAFGVFDAGKATERIVIMIETRLVEDDSAEQRDQLRLEVRGRMLAAGYQVDEICLVPKGTLPLTTSGKVRRQACREIFLRRQAAVA
jgi:acyl-CoA synthetase (AMP-forming)/AMP-acid ligase II